MFDSQHHTSNLGHAGSATQSTRGRKKKNAAASSNQGKMYRQQQQHYGQAQHQGQFGQRGGSSSFASQMPPPSMKQSLRHSTGMGLGLPEEDSSDFILDDLDRLTPRNIAMARYKRNHELLSLVFDARRIDSLEPPASPYADIDQDALRKTLDSTQDEIAELRESHAKRIKVLKEDFAKQDAYLHAVKKKGKGLSMELDEDVGQAEGDEEQVEPEEAWAKDPSKGRIVGVGYVRVSTPDEVRALLPKAPPPVSASTPLPVPAAVAEAAPSSELSSAATQSGQGEQLPAPLLTTTGLMERDQSGIGEDTAMTGITLEGTEAGVGEEEEGDEEDEDEDEDLTGDQTGLVTEGEGDVDADADADADAEGDEDADADGDADEDADEDADADGDAEEEGESILVKEEQPVDVTTEQAPIVEASLLDTSMQEPEMEQGAALESVVVAPTESDNVEVARVEKERELVEEVNRQHGVPMPQDAGPEELADVPEEVADQQVAEEAAPPPEASLTAAAEIEDREPAAVAPSTDEEMASVLADDADPVIS